MVVLEDANLEQSYVPAGSPAGKRTPIVLGGSFTDGSPQLATIIPLKLQMELTEAGIGGEASLIREFHLPPTLLSQVLPLYEFMRSLVVNEVARVINNQVNHNDDIGASVMDDPNLLFHYLLGNVKLMESAINTVIDTCIVKEFLQSLSGFFRNDVGQETFHVFTGAPGITEDGNINPVHMAMSVELPNHRFEIKLPQQMSRELTPVKAGKLQFCVIEALRGVPAGYRGLRFLTLCHAAGLESDSIRDKPFTNYSLIDVLDSISGRPCQQTVGNLLAYIGDKIIEIATFDFVRYKLRPSEWIIDCPWSMVIYNTTAQAVKKSFENLRTYYEIDQVICPATQGSYELKFLPFVGMTLTDQFRGNENDGNPGVHLTYLHQSVQARSEITWHYFRPRTVNAFEKTVTAHFNKAFNKLDTNAEDADGGICHILSVQPPVFSKQCPEYGRYRERPIMWPLFANLHPTVGLLTFNSVYADDIGIDTYLSGKWYALDAEYQNTITLAYSIKGESDDPVEMKMKYTPEIFAIKVKPFLYREGKNMFKIFTKLGEMAKKYRLIDANVDFLEDFIWTAEEEGELLALFDAFQFRTLKGKGTYSAYKKRRTPSKKKLKAEFVQAYFEVD